MKDVCQAVAGHCLDRFASQASLNVGQQAHIRIATRTLPCQATQYDCLNVQVQRTAPNAAAPVCIADVLANGIE